MMKCTVLVDTSVDIPHNITLTWLRSGLVLNTDDHVMISNVTKYSLSFYDATMTINALSKTTDTGTYTCSVLLQSRTTEVQVQGSHQSDAESIIIKGITFRYTVTRYWEIS